MMYRQIPVLRQGTARYNVLLWLCTDAPGTWTQKEMLLELSDMGISHSTGLYAIAGLAQRGLIERTKESRRTVLRPTYQGTQAIKPYIQRAKA